MKRHPWTAAPVPLRGERFQLENRLFQGCPSLVRTPRGRLILGYYSGGSREPSLLNYNIVSVSDDGGATWRELFALPGCPEKRLQALDVELFLDPAGRLWVCFVQRDWSIPKTSEGHLNQYALICDDPDAPELIFSAPRFLGEGFLRCQPAFLRDGRWLLPAYHWRHDRYAWLETADGGETFVERSGPRKIATDFDETMFLESADGGSIEMLARTKAAGALAYSRSTDGGKSWSEAVLRPDLPDPSSRFFWRRLPSGRVLMVKNLDGRARIAMTAMLSEDDGASWPWRLLLDARETSYPEAACAPDGTIFIVYDHGRCSDREILLSRITEEDILAGTPQSPGSFLSRVVSKAPAHPALGDWYRQALELYDQATIPLPL